MATDLGELIYTLTLNDEGFEGKLNSATDQVKESSGQITSSNEEVEESAHKSGGAMSSMAGQFVAGATLFAIGQKALDGVKEAIKGAIEEAKGWQVQQAGLNQELKSTKDVSGLTAEEVTKMAEHIQDTTPISRQAALAGDNMLLTFTNLHKNVFPGVSAAVADMATRMNNGAIPNAQQMSQTALQLGKALNDPANGITRLTKEGVTFSDQQKEQIKTLEKSGNMFGAQKVILAEVNKEFGGQAAANMKTYNGQVEALRNKFNDLVGNGIQKLEQELAKLANFILQHKALAEALGGALAGLAIVIGVAMVSALVSAAASFLALDLAALPWIAAAIVIGALAVLIISNWKKLEDWFKAFISNVKQWFDDAINFIKSHWVAIVGILTGPIGLAIAMIISHFQEIKHAFTTVVDFIKNAVKDWNKLLLTAGEDLIKGLINGVKNMAGAAGDAVKDVGKGMVNEAKKALKILSPSKVFAEIGENVSLGMAQGVTNTADKAVQATSQMSGKMVSAGNSVPAMQNSNNSSQSQSIIYQFQSGSVVLDTKEAVDEFFNIGNRSLQLELNGGSPLAGTTGV